MLNSILAISIGASLGALLRWFLANSLNALFPHLPPGTLVANLSGGYLIGVAMACFALQPNISPEWRLLIVTGFLGGLTTFSTFSAEVVALIQEDKIPWALATLGSHTVGSLLMTFLGLLTVHTLRHFSA